MTKAKEPRQSRASTYFKFYSEKFLWGSTRSELLPDERAVWIDFLCLASMNFGEVEIYSRDQTAQQLMISRELLDRSIDKFVKHGKVKRRYNKRKKKEIFLILNWSRFQADFLTKRLERSTSYEKKERSEMAGKSEAENQPILKKRKGEEKKSEETILEENKEDDSYNPKSPSLSEPKDSSPLPSNLTPSFNKKGDTKKDQFLSMLKDCSGYPFNETLDAILFDSVVTEYPHINIIKQTEKKIKWWRDRPDALDAKPREQLESWFKDEEEFQNRGGPQPIGEILNGVIDKDHRNFIKQAMNTKPKTKKPEKDYE